MTWALARKELRQLRPWAVLGLVIWGIDFVEALLGSLDRRPLGGTFPHLSATFAPEWVLAFAIGTALYTREEDDGTLPFLDGLPVSRGRVFFIKLAVATGVLLVYPALKLALVLALHLASRESLDADVHWTLLGQFLCIQLLLVWAGLACGAGLGRLRSLTWLVASTAAVGLGLLVEKWPRSALLDPLSLAKVETMGLRLYVDREALLAQLAMAAVWTTVAWAGFERAGRPRVALLTRRPVLSALVSVLTVGAALGVVGVRSRNPATGTPRASAAPRFEPSAPAMMATRHYRFSYPAAQARAAVALAEAADDIFEEVHRLLQVPPGTTIDVDASGSAAGTEGTAFFGGIRLKLEPNARAVLAHETSHVVAQRVAGDERAWLWAKAPVLNEGLASWVEHHFDGNADARREDRLQLAALHHRGELKLEELVDTTALASVRDHRLKYTAGEAFIEAMVRVYGADAVPRLLSAFAGEHLPAHLDGLGLWQACFQLAGMDLGRVVDALFREVEKDVRSRLGELAALPRPRVVLLSSDGQYGAEGVVAGALPEGWRLTLRFRPAQDSKPSGYETFVAEPGEPVWREASRIRGGRVCVQCGVELPHGAVLYEPWACLPVRDAIPWTPAADAGGPNTDEPVDEDEEGEGEGDGSPQGDH